MKRIITALLLSGMLLSLVSCMDGNEDTLSSTSSSQQETSDTSGSSGGVNGESETAPAKKFLQSVYGAFLEWMMPVYGVDSAENVKGYFAGPETETVTETDEDTGEEYSYELPKNEPGSISLDDSEYLESQTLFPAASLDRIGSAAVFFNTMNMNNGTFAAFEVKNAEDVQALADILKSKVKNNQWICGFPERFLIMRADNVLIFSYGLADSVNAFKSAVSSEYTNASVLYDEAL